MSVPALPMEFAPAMTGTRRIASRNRTVGPRSSPDPRLAFPMQPRVLTSINGHQVLNPIVKLDAIDVVDMSPSFNGAINLGPYESVLQHTFAIGADQDIAIRCNAAPFPSVAFLASSRPPNAAFFPSRRHSNHWFATLLTPVLSPSHRVSMPQDV